MGRADLNQVVGELYRDALAGIERAIGRGAAILLAHVGDGERELLEHYPRPFIPIEATLYPDRDAVRFQLLRESVRTLTAPADPLTALRDTGPGGDSTRLALAEAYGGRAGHVAAMLERDSPPTHDQLRFSIDEVLGRTPDDVPIVVFDAHRLERDARWDIRELERPLLLVTRPDHRGLTSEDAAFYAQAQTVSLRSPGPPEWMRALANVDLQMHTADLEWLLERCRGRVGTTTSIIEGMVGERSPRDAWRQAVRRSLPWAYETLALARELHSYAPSLLVAIAQARKPYTVVRDAASARIALALRKLQRLDIIEQPVPRTWRIADPLLEGALIHLADGAGVHNAVETLFE